MQCPFLASTIMSTPAVISAGTLKKTDMPDTEELTSLKKLSRVIQLFWILQAIIGLQKIKIKVD